MKINTNNFFATVMDSIKLLLEFTKLTKLQKIISTNKKTSENKRISGNQKLFSRVSMSHKFFKYVIVSSDSIIWDYSSKILKL